MTTTQTILVAGASGFIAGHIVKKICCAYPDASVIGVARQSCPRKLLDLANFEYVAMDLLDSAALNRLPNHVDTIMHFAGDRRSFVPDTEFTEQIYSNVLLTSALADYAVRAKASQFLFASSVYIYSGCSKTPFREDCTEYPKENLGASKLGAEAILNARSNAGHFASTSFRIFTTYGPGTGHDQFLPIAIKKLLSPEPVATFGNPDIKRDFVYIDDVVEAVLKKLQAEGSRQVRDAGNQTLNVGSGTATSIREVVALLAEILNVTKPIEFQENIFPAREGDNDHEADLNKVRFCLGWEPKTSLEQGLRELVLSLDNQ